MASFVTCRVHPNVVLAITDAYERRPETRDGAIQDKILGTLLGSYEKGVIEVTNCYSVPHVENGEDVQLNTKFNDEMYELHKKASPGEIPVGWFTTIPEPNTNSQLFHNYYQSKFIKDALSQTRDLASDVVLLTVNTKLIGERLDMRAYVRMAAGIPKTADKPCTLFMPVNVELAAIEKEQVALSTCERGVEDAKRLVRLFGGVEQVASTAHRMLKNVEDLMQYVDSVIAGRVNADPQVGRRLNEIVSSVKLAEAEHMEQLLSGYVKDNLMVIYLSQLARTQLSLYQSLVKMDQKAA